MTYKPYGKFAFVYDECENNKGFDINLVYKIVNGCSSGVSISGLFNAVDDISKGINIATCNAVGKAYGLNIGLANAVKQSYCVNVGGVNFHNGTFHGLDIGAYNLFWGDSKGVNIAVAGNVVSRQKDREGASKGCNIAGLVNYVNKPEGVLIQYATLSNIVSQENPDAFVLNIGLWNRIGNKHHPFIQVYGLKNIPKLFKKNKTKEKNSLEQR